jgi:hypothetical protein
LRVDDRSRGSTDTVFTHTQASLSGLRQYLLFSEIAGDPGFQRYTAHAGDTQQGDQQQKDDRDDECHTGLFMHQAWVFDRWKVGHGI